MSIYPALRDDTVAGLIEGFGLDATLRQRSGDTYDPATGTNGGGFNVDTAIKLLDKTFNAQQGAAIFSEELVKVIDKVFLVSAKELAAVSREPGIDDEVVVSGVSYRIRGISPVSPGGIVVLYRIGASRS